MKMFNWLPLSALVVLIACSPDDGVTVKSDVNEGNNSVRETNDKGTAARKETLRLQRVSSSVINSGSLATLKKNRPNLYNRLTIAGNLLKADERFSLYSNEDITVLIGNNDSSEGFPEETTITISGYEKIPIDIIGNLILWAVCQCEEGSDDCKFERDEEGNLGECTGGGACSDCRGGFELSGPEGVVLEVEAAF